MTQPKIYEIRMNHRYDTIDRCQKRKVSYVDVSETVQSPRRGTKFVP